MFEKLFRPKLPTSSTSVPGDLREAITTGTPRAMALWLAGTDHVQRDDQLAGLDENQSVALTELLTPETAGELLDSVSPHTALVFLERLPRPVAAGLLDTVDSDDATRIIELMDDGEKQEILRAMEFSHSALVRGLLAWPDESAASRMRPEFLHVGPEATIQQAVEEARKDPDDLEEGVFVTTPTDSGQVALGWLSPSTLVLSSRSLPVTAVMVPAKTLQQWAIPPLADQETVDHRVRARDSQVVPVMDGVLLLGVITSDTVSDILSEEATEDAERQGGSAPLDVPYPKASPGTLWKKRVGWLLVLFIAEMYTGSIMRAFEDELATVVALSFFVPLLIGTGGNVGTQITTTLIRAMSADGVQMKDMGRVLAKELSTGVLIAVTMAAAGLVRAWTLGVAWPVMVTVTVSLAAIVLWSSLVASMLPLILRRVGLDPAVVSAPMIATVVDGTGLLIYFMIAQALIPGL